MPPHHNGNDRRPPAPPQQPQRFPNQQPGPPPHHQWHGNQPGPPHHGHDQQFVGNQTPQHQAPPPPPEETRTTAQGLPWIALDQQLQITKENPITPAERALRDRAVELHIASFPPWETRPSPGSVKAEFQHYKVGLDGRFVAVEAPPPPPRPARLTADYLNQLMSHVAKHGSQPGVTPSFERGSDNLPPGRTREIPHGALAATATPVHGGEVRFNDEHAGVIWVDQRQTFLNPENAVWRRMGQDIGPMMDGPGILPRGTSGNLDAHVAFDTANSAHVSFTTDLAHALEREAGKSSGIQNGTRVEHVAEAYHPFGIDTDDSYHDAGQKPPHVEHERIYPGGMPRENIYRFWRIETVVENGFVVSTRIVGPPIMNRHFKYRSPEGS